MQQYVEVTVGSLFDGICGFPAVAQMAGGRTLWTSEIEPFPIAVAVSRFPDVIHYLDVSTLKGAEIPPVDVMTFGSPCQDMSVAGKQRGMKHEELGDEETTRSGLFFEAVRLIKEMREATNEEYPRIAVWENVPGAFSSNQGRDFLAVLQTLASIAELGVSIPEPKGLRWSAAGCIVGNGWSIAWRTYDAQYWGVPQRRRRIYLVADFGSERASEILFERYSVSGHSASRDEAGQETPADAVGRADRSVGVECLNPWDTQTQRIYSADGIHPAVFANSGGGQDRHGVVYPEPDVSPDIFHTLASTNARCVESAQSPNCVAIHQNADGEVRVSEDAAYTINTNGNASGRNSPVIVLQANGIDRADTADLRENEAYTLNTIDRHAVVFENHAQDSRVTECDDVAPTVFAKYGTGGGNTPIVCETYQNQVGALCSTDYKWVQQQVEQNKLVVQPTYFTQQRSDEFAQCEIASTESARQYKDATDLVVEHPRRYIVRRLTPTECLRLQGYPDDWCDIGIPHPDPAFWNDVRSTYARITGKTEPKPFTSEEAARTYVAKLKTDAAVYKAAGNSLALPCAYHVLSRVIAFLENERLGLD